MTGSKQRTEVHIWAHPSGELLKKTLQERRRQTGDKLLDELGSGIQTWAGESTWPAGFRVVSGES